MAIAGACLSQKKMGNIIPDVDGVLQADIFGFLDGSIAEGATKQTVICVKFLLC